MSDLTQGPLGPDNTLSPEQQALADQLYFKGTSTDTIGVLLGLNRIQQFDLLELPFLGGNQRASAGPLAPNRGVDRKLMTKVLRELLISYEGLTDVPGQGSLSSEERRLAVTLRRQGESLTDVGVALGLTRLETFDLLEAGDIEGEKAVVLAILEANET